MRLLWKIVVKNIKAHPRRGIQKIFVLSFSALLFFFLTVLYPYVESAYRQYQSSEYGDWYACARIPDDGLELCLDLLGQQDDNLRRIVLEQGEKWGISGFFEEDELKYGLMYIQENEDGLRFGCMEETLYDMCAIKLISGRHPVQDEIMITDTLAKQENLSIGDIFYDRIISGIVHVSQEEFFPDVYTTEPIGEVVVFFDRHFGTASGENELYLSVSLPIRLQYIENPHGYDHFTRTDDVMMYMSHRAALDDEKLSILISTVITIVILSVMYSLEGHQRRHEIALYRGIGMTVRQCVNVLLMDAFMIGIGGVIGGITILFAVCAGMDGLNSLFMHINDISFVMFVFEHLSSLLGTALLFMAFVITGTFVPALRCAQYSLQGNFDGSVKRYRHRKRVVFQSLWVLAYRELYASGIFTVCIMVFLTAVSVLFLPSNANRGMNNTSLDEGVVIAEFTDLHYAEIPGEFIPSIEGTQREVYMVGSLEEDCEIQWNTKAVHLYNSQIMGLDDLVEDRIRIVGRLPETDLEILVCPSYIVNMFNYMPVDVGIGDTIVIGGKTYTVSGLIEPIQTISIDHVYEYGPNDEMTFSLYPCPVCAVIFTQEEFKNVSSSSHPVTHVLYDDYGDTIRVLNTLYKEGVNVYSIGLSDMMVYYSRFTDTAFNIQLSHSMVEVPVALLLMIFTALQYRKVAERKKGYILMRSIGITEDQMLKKCVWQAFLLTVGSEALFIAYAMIDFTVVRHWAVPLTIFLTDAICVGMYCLAISILPMRRLKKYSFEQLMEAE